MSNSSAQTFENHSLGNSRMPGVMGVIAAASLAIAALIPVAIAAFGIARGGIEAYIVLAALVLG